MHKNASLLFGVTLIALALLALAGNLLAGATGVDIMRAGFHTWPLAVVGAGLLFCVPPFIFRQQKGLGGLFIPGLPVLTTGILLFVASVTGNWGLWGTLWPLEVIGVALGFVMAAIFLRVVWLMVPASIVGLTGMVLLFCSLTGLWAAWAVLWTVVPFSVGLPLLIIGIFQKNDGVKLAGLIVTGFAGLAFAAMSAIIVTTSWLTKIVGPVIILALGVFMVVSALVKKKAE
ncbi:MAG: hypothetical protein HY781_06475 [Chloroflexi bacterium]|nr:hypothetical protein [Chloroflexota bacterium]